MILTIHYFGKFSKAKNTKQCRDSVEQLIGENRTVAALRSEQSIDQSIASTSVRFSPAGEATERRYLTDSRPGEQCCNFLFGLEILH